LVCEYAIEEATAAGKNYVGTEHVLLGLIREQEGVASQVLMNMGLTAESVRAEVLRLLSQPSGTGVGPPEFSQKIADLNRSLFFKKMQYGGSKVGLTEETVRRDMVSAHLSGVLIDRRWEFTVNDDGSGSLVWFEEKDRPCSQPEVSECPKQD